jgi:uncharacterized DUF497 family protein
MQFNFEWDPQKDKSNQAKHGVSFEQAVTVFAIRMASLFLMMNTA